MNVLARFVALITRRFYPRGMQRMLRLLFNPKKMHIQTVVPYDRTLKINVDTSSYVEWELFFRGYYEKWVIDVIKKLVHEGDVAVDAGANIGTHTLILAKLVGASGGVFAFDPDPKSVKRLTENITLNHLTHVKILQSGLSDKEGSIRLFSYGNEMLDQGTASLYELPKLHKTSIEVPVQTLDRFVQHEGVRRFDFIKIDTRGSDFPIIRGARKTIEKFRPHIIFEYNRDNWERSHSQWEDAKTFFDANNYLLYLVDQKGAHFIEQATDAKTSYNILAIPKEKLSAIKLHE